MKQSTETKKNINRTAITLFILVAAITGMFVYSVMKQAGML